MKALTFLLNYIIYLFTPFLIVWIFSLTIGFSYQACVHSSPFTLMYGLYAFGAFIIMLCVQDHNMYLFEVYGETATETMKITDQHEEILSFITGIHDISSHELKDLFWLGILCKHGHAPHTIHSVIPQGYSTYKVTFKRLR